MKSKGSADNRQDVAIVGMACRFPGARNINEYWRLLSDPKPQFTAIPDSRWRHDSFRSDDFRDPYSAYTDKMAMLSDVGAFDAAHYKIPPRRAQSMDPQHRLLVDLAREAIQDAGWEADGFDTDNTAVITALSESGYRAMSAVNIRLRQLAGGEFGSTAPDSGWDGAGSAIRGFHGTALAGLLMNMGPSSVSSVFDLHGDSYALDAACSGGLAAVAEAVYALRSGRCRIALAGGAQLILVPDLLLGLCRVGAISPTGTCRPFDRRADGFVLGEGAGLLVLRPLADAAASGDRIYAVIRGAGLSNDGRVAGGMKPQASGQLFALHRAYADAGLPPGSVGYLEAHGTATPIGDEVEIDALAELRKGEKHQAYFGAAKSVVGHSLGTSGLAGLIKSILAVHKGQIPPQHEYEPAENLGLAAAGLKVATELTEWREPDDRPRRAGVSAFGFGGTNVHVVIEESPVAPPAPVARGPELLLLSARDRSGLARYAREVADVLAGDAVPLNTVAATLARRSPFAERLAVVADTPVDAIGRLMVASASLEAGRTGDIAPATVAGTVSPDAAQGDDKVADLSVVESATALEGIARQAVTGHGLPVVTEPRTLCTLPPSPLSPRNHWIVDESRTSRSGDARSAPARSQVAPAPAAITAPLPPVADPPPGAPAAPGRQARDMDVLDVVLQEVARISAFSARDLRPEQKLVADLGFDSLMSTELEVSLTNRHPHLQGTIEPDRDFTIAELADAIVAGRPGNAAVTADAAAAPLVVATPAPVAMAASAPVAAAVHAPQWDASTADISEFPEVAAHEARLGLLDENDVPNPYFRMHEGSLGHVTTIDGREYVSFSGYNYLGLSGHPVVDQAVHEAVERYGSSVSASRLLAGERTLTRRLETELAELVGTADAIVLVSGHATNVTAIGHIVGPEDLIVHDSLAHDSILQGCSLSRATRRPFAHNDFDQLEYILQRTRSRYRRVLLVAEGAYSMDGDLVDLPRLIELKRRYGTLIMIDEAHSIGTVGRSGGGVGDFFGVERSDVDLWMGTLSKSLASCGGYLAGSARTIGWLKYTLPGFVYSVGMTPANAAAALAAVRLIKSEPERVTALHANTKLFLTLARKEGIATGSAGNTPIVPCIVGDSGRTLRLASRLFEQGIVADPILYPAVAEHETRLRFFLTSEHTPEEIGRTVSVLSSELRSLR